MPGNAKIISVAKVAPVSTPEKDVSPVTTAATEDDSALPAKEDSILPGTPSTGTPEQEYVATKSDSDPSVENGPSPLSPKSPSQKSISARSANSEIVHFKRLAVATYLPESKLTTKILSWFALFQPLADAELQGDSIECDVMDTFGKAHDMTFAQTFVHEVKRLPGVLLQAIIVAICFVIVLSTLALCPVVGATGSTPLTGFLNSFLILSFCTPAMFNMLIGFGSQKAWDYIPYFAVRWPVLPISFGLCGYLAQSKGMDVKKYAMVPYPFVMITMAIFAPAVARMHMKLPVQKWVTCCKYPRPLKVTLSACLVVVCNTMFMGFVMPLWIRSDTTTFSRNKSKIMVIARPLAFLVMKKLCWSGAGLASRFRHTWYLVGCMTACSVSIGFAVALTFTNTANWTSVGIFVLFDWLGCASKIWCVTGAVWSDKLKILSYYRTWLLFGKPLPTPNMLRKKLRGFEIMIENQEATMAIVTILLMYPVGKYIHGHDSMVFNLLFPTENSFFFVGVALFSELLQDISAKAAIMYNQKCSFDFHLAVVPSRPVLLGILWNIGFCSCLVVNNGFVFQQTQTGPFTNN